MTQGRLVVLEGGEGVGKSTQARRLRDWIADRGREVLLTREPGGSPLAEAVRGLVLGDWEEGIDPTTELLLIFAARAAHLHATIRPALERGAVVICDRFVDASWAYQGAGRGVPDARLAALETMVLDGLRADLTVVLDLPPQVGLARAQARGDANRFEAETLDFMQRVRAVYLARAAAAPSRYAVVDAAADVDTVSARLRELVGARL